MRLPTAYLGLAAAAVFIIAFFVIAMLTPDYALWYDYISKLGALGQPLAPWWNAIGFVVVGILFSAFGWTFGRTINDRIVGGCLVAAGLGFTLGAIPADFANADAPLSKAHFVSICIALAGWCFALARMGQTGPLEKSMRIGANIAGVLVVLPMVGTAANLFTAPVAHRLVLVVVFGWVIFVSLKLLSKSHHARISTGNG
ncbi:MAG: DUF998 domain-containing protein [Bacteroidota bacterium]